MDKKSKKGIFLTVGLICSIGLGYGIGQYVHLDKTVHNKVENIEVSEAQPVAETSTTTAVKKVNDSVVSIFNLQTNVEFSQGIKTEIEETAGEGSGVIYKVDKDKTFVVTNNHVIENSNSLKVQLSNGKVIDGNLISSDDVTDLAVIEVKTEESMKPATFADSNEVQIGETAIAIGSPLGSVYANTATQGIVSGINREVTNGTTIINAIQTDAAINPGNSGGALININGDVIGINSIKITNSSSNVNVEGMGFAIPSNDVKEIINQLETGEKIDRPFLGVTVMSLGMVPMENRRTELKIPDTVKEGAVISSVFPDSPADKAGLKEFDVITKVDGEGIETNQELIKKLYKYKVGDKMKLTVQIEDKTKEVEVDLNQKRDEMNFKDADEYVTEE